MDNKSADEGITLDNILGISEKRIEELKNMTKKMFNKNTYQIDGNTYALDVAKLIIECEIREDMILREKLLCIFQIGMNAQRMLRKSEEDKKIKI